MFQIRKKQELQQKKTLEKCVNTKYVNTKPSHKNKCTHSTGTENGRGTGGKQELWRLGGEKKRKSKIKALKKRIKVYSDYLKYILIEIH